MSRSDFWYLLVPNHKKQILPPFFTTKIVYFIVYTSSNSRQLQWNFVFNDLISQNTENCEQNRKKSIR